MLGTVRPGDEVSAREATPPLLAPCAVSPLESSREIAYVQEISGHARCASMAAMRDRGLIDDLRPFCSAGVMPSGLRDDRYAPESSAERYVSVESQGGRIGSANQTCRLSR
jgi:hypothetical protein